MRTGGYLYSLIHYFTSTFPVQFECQFPEHTNDRMLVLILVIELCMHSTKINNDDSGQNKQSLCGWTVV